MERTSQIDLPTNSFELSNTARVLCKIAGSDLSILAQCPHEVSRHARIGAVIITTSVLAFVSMFFAIETISQSPVLGVVAGLMWALAIFVLDSYIIASYKKNDDKLKEFKVAIPRLILALILGCTISIPMELKVFANEISEQMKILEVEMSNKTKEELKKGYDKDRAPYLQEKENLLNDNKGVDNTLQPLKDRVEILENELRDEIGAKGRTGKAGYGTMAKSIDEQLQSAKNDYQNEKSKLAPKLEANYKRITQLDSIIATIPVPEQDPVRLYGISAQLDALKRLTSSNNYVLFAYWVFFLLIIGIETAPIFVKFFTPKGSYDEILATKEYLIFLDQQKKKSDVHEFINQELDSIRTLSAQRKLAQDAANQTLMNAIAEAQGEVARKAIALWKQKQLEKVNENLDSFIKTSQNAFPVLPFAPISSRSSFSKISTLSLNGMV